MSAPVKHTCPDINKVIKKLESMQVLAQQGMEDHERFSDEYDRYKQIEWDIDSIIDSLEDLRKANSALREWGEKLDDKVEELKEEIEELKSVTI